ncbi:MAG TPA: hypothetical protein VGS21_11400, partial [Acidimicrobiales bacterium]|nr:hypothetical protein [Acidimicrobiales bacterium]
FNWKLLTLPNLPGAVSTSLNGISCSSPTRCTAGGYFRTATSGLRAFADVLDGNRWSAVHPYSPWMDSSIVSVSCLVGGECVSAGGYSRGPSTGDPLVYISGTGQSWTRNDPIVPAGVNANLDFVSCSSPTSCMLVGSRSPLTQPGATPLAEYWNGAHWTVTHTVIGG